VVDRAALAGAASLRFDLGALGDWDSSLVVHLLKTVELAEAASVAIDLGSLPGPVRKLVDLSRSLPEAQARGGGGPARPAFAARVGLATVRALGAVRAVAEFVGEATLAMLGLLRGRVVFRWRDFFVLVHECGAKALPIVGLIAVLTGLILAFVGAVQLLQFGAEIYVADMVGIAMVREMGALMSGVIMAGRSGAAFAASIGSMKANEEIDALTTLGIDPVAYLVTPRVLAITLMMPLLCLYADLLGMLGGMVISDTMLDISPAAYFRESRTVVTLTQVTIGVVKATVFGIIIGLAGCYHGMGSGTDAAAVGRATTSAVVSAIVFIVIADSAAAVVLDALKL
jgi:phospholipid/cholesterol/gamma-HCH transport system permease protein